MNLLEKLGQFFKNHVLLLLLIGQLVLCAFKGSSFSDSLIVLTLAALYAFKMFVDYRPRKDITQLLSEQKLQIYQEMSLLKADMLDKISKASFGINPGVKNGPKEPPKRIHF